MFDLVILLTHDSYEIKLKHCNCYFHKYINTHRIIVMLQNTS